MALLIKSDASAELVLRTLIWNLGWDWPLLVKSMNWSGSGEGEPMMVMTLTGFGGSTKQWMATADSDVPANIPMAGEAVASKRPMHSIGDLTRLMPLPSLLQP